MVINNHLLTGNIYYYRNWWGDGDTITADSENEYSIHARFIGNEFITDVKVNFTTYFIIFVTNIVEIQWIACC